MYKTPRSYWLSNVCMLKPKKKTKTNPCKPEQVQLGSLWKNLFARCISYTGIFFFSYATQQIILHGLNSKTYFHVGKFSFGFNDEVASV